MDVASTLASAPRRVRNRLYRLRRRRKAREARVVRQQELDRQLGEAENMVAELEDAGLIVHVLQVSTSLKETDSGLSSGPSIHVSASYEEHRWARS